MEFGVLGISFKNAPLAVRDHIAFTDNTKIDFMQKADSFGVRQCLVLSTCNRNEVFYFYDDETQRQRMRDAYLATFPGANLEGLLLDDSGTEAYRYLFRIAAGLESAVLGEDQILGQLKDALVLSRALGTCKKELSRVFENAMGCAKELKTKYRVSEIPLSVGYIGIREANRRAGFDGKDVLIIGSGQTAVLALRYVVEYDVRSITLCSRNPAHAGNVKVQFPDIDIVLYEDRYEKMKESDIVISATSSPRYAVDCGRCELHRKTLFLDLAAPRDIDPAIEGQNGAVIINLDFLNEVSKENQKERERLIALCEDDIDRAVNETVGWLFGSRVDATIESLQQRCDLITEDSFSYLDRKLTLSPREQKILKKILRASLRKLIREPILELKQLQDAESQEKYTKALESLFRL